MRINQLFASLVIPFSLACFTIQPSNADALVALNNEFRSAYEAATAQTMAETRARVPVLVNRFGQVSLYRPGIATPEIFSMKMGKYLEARSVAHAAAAVYVGIAPFGMGALDQARLGWLAKYERLLVAAEGEVQARTDLPDDIKLVQVALLSDVRHIVQRIYQRGTVDQELLSELGRRTREGIRTCLKFAAASQLDQFKAQVDEWKAAYPDLRWKDAVVVIIGIHQARRNYLQRQFFDWLLQDNAISEDRVVFAETIAPPPPLEKAEPADALLLLSKVMLDKGLSMTIFENTYAMQSDVLGDAAAEIIKGWGGPN